MPQDPGGLVVPEPFWTFCRLPAVVIDPNAARNHAPGLRTHGDPMPFLLSRRIRSCSWTGTVGCTTGQQAGQEGENK
jgi:hypothetical protein